jgi:hypothetical protein
MMHEPIYPDAAGYKGVADTGSEAAEAMNDKLGRLQRLVADTLRPAGPFGLTPEEAAEQTGLSRASIQPRFSELRRKGLIVDSGNRRRNPSSGKRAVAWCLKEFAPVAMVEGADHGARQA